MGTLMSTYSRSHDTGTLINMDATRYEQAQAVPRAPAGWGSGRRPGGPHHVERVSELAAPNEARVSALAARQQATSELLQVSQVVLIKEPDVGRPRSKHRQSLYAPHEGEALVAGWVVADAAKDVRVDHAAAGGLDPAVAAADVALGIAALAGEAVERDLRRWLREREVVDPKTDLAVATDELSRERIERPCKAGHLELLFDLEALVLEEDRLADRVSGLVSVAASGYHYSDRRLALLHHPHLHGGRVRTSKEWSRRIVAERIRDPERLPFLPRRMAGRDVEGLERVVVPFDLGTLDRLEAKRPEDPRDLADRLRDRVQPSHANAPRRKRHVLALSAEIALQGLRSQRGP